MSQSEAPVSSEEPAREGRSPAAKRRRGIFRALEMERIAAFHELAQRQSIAESIRSRSLDRGVGKLDLSPPESDSTPLACSIPTNAPALIASQLDNLSPPLPRAAADSPDTFDPCREAPWWQLEGRSGA